MRYRLVDTDRHDALELPDGTRAASLRLGALRAEMQRLGIKVAAKMSKNEMLDLYAARVAEVVEELRTANTEQKSLTLPQTAMREAVAFIERQSA